MYIFDGASEFLWEATKGNGSMYVVDTTLQWAEYSIIGGYVVVPVSVLQ